MHGMGWNACGSHACQFPVMTHMISMLTAVQHSLHAHAAASQHPHACMCTDSAQQGTRARHAISAKLRIKPSQHAVPWLVGKELTSRRNCCVSIARRTVIHTVCVSSSISCGGGCHQQHGRRQQQEQQAPYVGRGRGTHVRLGSQLCAGDTPGPAGMWKCKGHA